MFEMVENESAEKKRRSGEGEGRQRERNVNIKISRSKSEVLMLEEKMESAARDKQIKSLITKRKRADPASECDCE